MGLSLEGIWIVLPICFLPIVMIAYPLVNYFAVRSYKNAYQANWQDTTWSNFPQVIGLLLAFAVFAHLGVIVVTTFVHPVFTIIALIFLAATLVPIRLVWPGFKYEILRLAIERTRENHPVVYYGMVGIGAALLFIVLTRAFQLIWAGEWIGVLLLLLGAFVVWQYATIGE